MNMVLELEAFSDETERLVFAQELTDVSLEQAAQALGVDGQQLIAGVWPVQGDWAPIVEKWAGCSLNEPGISYFVGFRQS